MKYSELLSEKKKYINFQIQWMHLDVLFCILLLSVSAITLKKHPYMEVKKKYSLFFVYMHEFVSKPLTWIKIISAKTVRNPIFSGTRCKLVNLPIKYIIKREREI